MVLFAFVPHFVASIVLLAGGPSPNTLSNEVAVIPIDAETLVPVTRETIWDMSCRRNLSSASVREWRTAIKNFREQKDLRFNGDAVRVGLRLGDEIYYLDRQLSLEGPDPIARAPVDHRTENDVRRIVASILQLCGEGGVS